MHPMIAYQLALTLCDDKRQAAQRSARGRRGQTPKVVRENRPRLRALWLAKLHVSRVW